MITAGGYREPITLPQIRSNLEMDSHEERLQLMIKQTKMDAAQDQARAAATSIREQKASGMVGIGGGSGPESNDYDFQSRPSGRDFNDSGVSSDYNSPSPYDSAPAPAPKPVIAKKGMSLGAFDQPWAVKVALLQLKVLLVAQWLALCAVCQVHCVLLWPQPAINFICVAAV